MLNEIKRLHVYLEKPARVDIEMWFHWKQIISLSFDREIHLGKTSRVQGWVGGVLFDINNRTNFFQIPNHWPTYKELYCENTRWEINWCNKVSFSFNAINLYFELEKRLLVTSVLMLDLKPNSWGKNPTKLDHFSKQPTIIIEIPFDIIITNYVRNMTSITFMFVFLSLAYCFSERISARWLQG